jgi:SSS family solute:Na+ symporter
VLDRPALLSGWLVGTVLGHGMTWALEFESMICAVSIFRLNVPVRIAIYALAVNFVISVALSTLSRLFAAWHVCDCGYGRPA